MWEKTTILCSNVQNFTGSVRHPANLWGEGITSTDHQLSDQKHLMWLFLFLINRIFLNIFNEHFRRLSARKSSNHRPSRTTRSRWLPASHWPSWCDWTQHAAWSFLWGGPSLNSHVWCSTGISPGSSVIIFTAGTWHERAGKRRFN